MKKEELKQQIREEIQCFMEHHDVLTRLDGVDWHYVEDALVELLTGDTSCQRLVANLYDRHCHERDVLCYIDWDEHDEDLMDDIEKVTDLFEKNLSNDDGWYYCLDNALDEFERSEGYDN